MRVINTDKSWEIKENAILALKNITRFHVYCDRVLEAGGLTAVLRHLREDSPNSMPAVYFMLKHMTIKMPDTYYDPYIHEVITFILSHLHAFTDKDTRCYFFLLFQEIAQKCASYIELNEDICTSLIQLIDTTDGDVSCSIIKAVTYIILATNEFTELLIECGLLMKIRELLPWDSNKTLLGYICFFFSIISEQTTAIVDKVVHSGVIPEAICLIGSMSFRVDEVIINALGNI